MGLQKWESSELIFALKRIFQNGSSMLVDPVLEAFQDWWKDVASRLRETYPDRFKKLQEICDDLRLYSHRYSIFVGKSLCSLGEEPKALGPLTNRDVASPVGSMPGEILEREPSSAISSVTPPENGEFVLDSSDYGASQSSFNSD